MIISGWCLSYEYGNNYRFFIDSYKHPIQPNEDQVLNGFGSELYSKKFHDYSSYVLAKIDKYNNLVDYLIWNIEDV